MNWTPNAWTLSILVRRASFFQSDVRPCVDTLFGGSQLINLQKSQEKAGIHLNKHGVNTSNIPKMRVGICLDVSGSMQDEYTEGHVHEALGHLLGLATRIDQSQQMEVFLFDHRASHCRPVSASNIDHYVDHEIIHGGHHLWGITSYAPPIHLAYQHYFPELKHLHSHTSLADHHERSGLFSGGLFRRHKKAEPVQNAANHDPVLMLFLTDGACDDEHETLHALHASNDLPLFWAFVGLNHDSRVLREFAEESDAEFVNLPHIRVDDDALFSAVVSPKLGQWLKSLPR